MCDRAYVFEASSLRREVICSAIDAHEIDAFVTPDKMCIVVYGELQKYSNRLKQAYWEDSLKTDMLNDTAWALHAELESFLERVEDDE